MSLCNSAKAILLSAVLFLGGVCASAQQGGSITVSGTVTDAIGPVVGVGIVQQGTTNGTATDIDGKYSLTVPRGATLEISSIGYATQTVTADRATIDIVLEEDTEMIEETIVVGYGTTTRKNFTGSVSTLKTSEGGVALTAPTNALDMLRGMSPGVSMSQSGVAGSTPSIQIRGQKSINGGSDPLLVVNGVIFKGTINDIDPSIVESMSVLKDATSLAAYGSQAANGVIMITTKKGERGKPMINFGGSIALSTPNYKPDIFDGYDYIRLYNAKKGYAEDDTSWLSAVARENYESGNSTDWFDYSTRTGVRQNYTLSLSGGTDSMDYMVGVSHLDNKNFIKGNEYIRQTINSRINTKVNDYIRVGFNINFSTYRNDGTTPYVGRLYTPWGSATYPDGTMRKYINGMNDKDQTNPLWSVYNGYEREVRNNSVTTGGEIEVKVPWVKGLSYKITGSYTLNQTKARSFTHEDNLITNTDAVDDFTPATTEMKDAHLSEAYGSITDTKNTSYVIDNILTYTRQFGRHWVSATAVYTRDADKAESTTMTGSDFSDVGNTTLGFYGLTNAKTRDISSIAYTLHMNIGYLGRVNYSYNDTYHLNASVRRDGSSVFGRDKKWGIFPAVGLAWSVSNESFWKKMLPGLTNTKLKLSWGKNGNQSLDPYGTLSQMAVGKSGGYATYFDDKVMFGQALETLGNPNLGWETTTSWNYGMETDLLKERIHFEIDAYNARTTDQIFQRDILSMGTGIRTQSATMGQVNNWGIEATVRSTNVRTSALTWTSQLQFSMNRNKLVELYGDGEDDITNELFLGHSLGAIYGYKWIGVIQEDDEAYMAANGGQPGDPMYEDTDGDGEITPDDKQILGYEKPAFVMSLANTLTYKNWTLYFLFNGTFSAGDYGVAENNFAFGHQDGSMDYLNGNNHPWWTAENKSDKYLRPGYDCTDGDFIGLQKYGFVRLQDLNLSYNLRGGLLSKWGIASLQVYLSGSNLFCIAPGWDFSDPEVRTSRGMQLARTYTLGVNIRF